jgi:hypothetical protein
MIAFTWVPATTVAMIAFTWVPAATVVAIVAMIAFVTLFAKIFSALFKASHATLCAFMNHYFWEITVECQTVAERDETSPSVACARNVASAFVLVRDRVFNASVSDLTTAITEKTKASAFCSALVGLCRHCAQASGERDAKN